MPAQEQSPSIPADSQKATEEGAKEENDNKETESDLIFPKVIKQQDNDYYESWDLIARTGQRKRTPTSIYTNKEETRKKAAERKKTGKKELGYINAAVTIIMVA